LASLFRITVGQELHGALQVGKQYGDLLALAFEGGLGGEDFFREIGGHVSAGRLGLIGQRGRACSPRR
jgi:hypothetical protein